MKDNIMYGIKDDYRIFKTQSETVPPLRYEVDYNTWLQAAYLHANSSLVVEEPLRGCVDVTGDTSGVRCPGNSDKGWMYYLNRDETGAPTNQHKKASATPRVYNRISGVFPHPCSTHLMPSCSPPTISS